MSPRLFPSLVRSRRGGRGSCLKIEQTVSKLISLVIYVLHLFSEFTCLVAGVRPRVQSLARDR